MAKARVYRESASVEKPPAFQEYAAQALSAEPVKLMSLAELGLFVTMRWYCWCNDSVPSDPAAMARALGRQETEVRDHLTLRVRTFFEPAEDRPDRLICPALVRQMAKLMQRREAQAQGGRDAAKARREKRNPALANRASNHTATHVGLEYRTAQNKTTQLGKEEVKDPFVVDMEAAEAREKKAGGGG